jgi:hypothetical protein
MAEIAPAMEGADPVAPVELAGSAALGDPVGLGVLVALVARVGSAELVASGDPADRAEPVELAEPVASVALAEPEELAELVAPADLVAAIVPVKCQRRNGSRIKIAYATTRVALQARERLAVMDLREIGLRPAILLHGRLPEMLVPDLPLVLAERGLPQEMRELGLQPAPVVHVPLLETQRRDLLRAMQEVDGLPPATVLVPLAQPSADRVVVAPLRVGIAVVGAAAEAAVLVAAAEAVAVAAAFLVVAEEVVAVAAVAAVAGANFTLFSNEKTILEFIGNVSPRFQCAHCVVVPRYWHS